MRDRIRRLLTGERGGISTEFAITMALLVFPLFIGTIDVSRLTHTGNILTRTAREAVVTASRGGDATPVALASAEAAGLDVAKLSVNTALVEKPGGHGTGVRVELKYNLTGFSLFPVDIFIPNGLTARAEARQE